VFSSVGVDNVVYGSDGVAAVQRIRRPYKALCAIFVVDGSVPGAFVHLGGPRNCLRVDVFPDVRHFAISNGNGDGRVVLERLIRGFDSPPSGADHQNPIALRHVFGGAWK
jgi:hypothetical protein